MLQSTLPVKPGECLGSLVSLLCELPFCWHNVLWQCIFLYWPECTLSDVIVCNCHRWRWCASSGCHIHTKNKCSNWCSFCWGWVWSLFYRSYWLLVSFVHRVVALWPPERSFALRCVYGHLFTDRQCAVVYHQVRMSSMSNVTLHPKSVNFLVDMRDEWERPGTICASVTVFGIHGISKLHVCVDCIIFPLGSVLFNGDAVDFLLTTGAPFTRKFPVAPEYEMAYWTSYIFSLYGC